jgi:hypothetical protein
MKTHVNEYRVYLSDSVSKAQNAIYNLGDPINGATIQRLLKATSTVPTSVSF